MDNSPTKSALPFVNLAEMVEEQAKRYPERVAFEFEDDAGNCESWTYATLSQRSRTLAAWLSKRVQVGDRVLLVYPPGLEFIAAFLGCVAAGVLPVPATYPRPRRPMPRLDSIVGDCGPSMVLTHSNALQGLCLEQQCPALSELTWETTDAVATRADAKFEPVSRTADDIAFLQYTSGSTSEPRGVMISHRNILHNIESIRKGFGVSFDEHARSVSWLPVFHDMGLIGGILAPLYVGATTTLIAPTTFLSQPHRWLELMSNKQASISGAPNFAYELMVRKTTEADRSALDLSHWRLAFCGAEPINPDTLTEFAAAFACAGFKPSAFFPCYGLAESTLLVTGSQKPDGPRVLEVCRNAIQNHQVIPISEKNSRSQSLVSCGPDCVGQVVQIVDPKTLALCEAGEVGEIWVRGESIARGYWQKEAINTETFRARIAANGQQHGGEFLRTGDLGFRHDGELFVTGRLKDVIIVRGRNHYPQDLERTAQAAHEAVDLGAAFSVDINGREEVVLVHQWRREFRSADPNQIIHAIRSAIVTEHEIDPHAIILIRPASLPITSSGKVQRRQCRQQYLKGELTLTYEWVNQHCAIEGPDGCEENLQESPGFLQRLGQLSPEHLQAELQSWLLRWISLRANLSPGVIEPTTPFAQLGIDSLTAVEISQEIDKLLGLQSPPMAIWTCPTPAELADFLIGELQTNTTKVGTIAAGGSQR